MASGGLQLLLLSCACSLAFAARDVKVICSEEVDLPCTAPWDPHVSYRISWIKLTEQGEEVIQVSQEDQNTNKQYFYRKEQNHSLIARPYSLSIRNTTSSNTGMYLCTLWDPEGQRNQSGSVTLTVIGCRKEHKEDNFKKYRAEILLLLALVVFYLTLIIFTCKFARLQSIFPDVSKPVMEGAFLPVSSSNKHLGPVFLQKTELV
ncbi:PREDICTED: CD83 antigen [Elephantulus edwardii]|uniref:CD83 antigen n=1 Tax=Elephantulus edwardii TaxID=28737 RepID=UPI0003F05839|nr:PREDICTED: CD83 antigen [Elephantulus edwardii]